MKRLKGFDYTKPYFYMVTLKRVKGLKPFGEITKEKEPPKDAEGRPRYLVANAITEAFVKVIREFHTKWRGLWPIECFTVMPDHLHLLVHLKDSGDQLALGKYVYQLMKALTAAYWGMADSGMALGMADGTAIANTLMASTAFNHKSVVLPAPSGSNGGNDPAPSGSNGGNDPAPSGSNGGKGNDGNASSGKCGIIRGDGRG